MPRQKPSDFGMVLKLLRLVRGWPQWELAKAAGLAGNLVSDYEQGRKPLSRERLESLIALMGCFPDQIETTLAFLDIVRTSESPLQGQGDDAEKLRRDIDKTALEVGRKVGQCFREVLTLFTDASQALEARQEAKGLWAKMRRYSSEQRLKLVEEAEVFRSWALCERVAAESIAAAPWAHVSNARRACNDLPGTETAMVKARKLWEDGEGKGSGLLEPAWLPWIEAGLRKDQRRFPEALNRIDEALAVDKGELRAQILMTKARIFEALGDPERSTAVLEEAAPLIDRQNDFRLAFGLRFNLLVNLCQLGRAAEAEPQLRQVRDLAKLLNEELDLARVAWLEGKIAAGTGKPAEACEFFQRVRRYFRTLGLAYDYALVSLELAAALLEQGRAAEIRGLAAEMLWIFQAQGVHREALAALRLFCEAAERERATAELTRRIVAYLHRAQHDPELRFE